MQLLSSADALQIEMRNARLERMHLNVAQNRLFLIGSNLYCQNRGVERLVFHLVEERVVIERQHDRIFAGAIHHGRYLASTTQAAARTLAFHVARFGAEFKFCHVQFSNNVDLQFHSPRDQGRMSNSRAARRATRR